MKKENFNSDLKDVTFLFLIKLDSIDRLENILASLEYIASNFNTNINILECASRPNNLLKNLIRHKVNYKFERDYDPILHRTKYLNRMVKDAHTPFVAIWDSDVIIHKKQIIDSISELRNNNADFVYPYHLDFLDTSDIIRDLYLENRNLDLLFKHKDKMRRLYLPSPVGGAFFCEKKAYCDSGLENEKFYGWGMEDGERYNRWDSMGFRIKKIQGPLFHLTHDRGINSTFDKDEAINKFRIVTSSIRKIVNSKTYDK